MWIDSLAELAPADVLDAAESAEDKGFKGAEVLLARGLDPISVLTAKARHYRCGFVVVERYEIDEEALSLLSEEQMRRHHLLPLFTLEDKLYVATANPTDLDAFENLSRRVGLSVEPVVAVAGQIELTLNKIFLSHDKMTQAFSAIGLRAGLDMSASTDQDEEERDEESSEAPAVQLVERIVTQGILLGASDIHLEPFEKRAVLRYRVDGQLREYPPPPLPLYLAMVSRIKIAANCDIAERRLPQDGRSSIMVDGKTFDLRISIMPGLWGEAIVIRILSSAAVSTDLTSLGFQEDILATWNRVIRKPHGIVLVTGPTGSGKSTTLYSTLRTIATPDRKIITLEDPVEYKMDGILQIPVNPDIGYTFAVGLRAILRHDPDVVLIGEIRDLESAEIAVRASLTGHALLSTLHTNSAPLALTRMIDMGVPGYMVLAALNGVLAQRLVRRLCPKCKIEADFPKESLRNMGVRDDVPLYGPRPGGCPDCNGIGYKGRIGIHEILEITPEIREMDSRQLNLADLIKAASRSGYRPLRDSGIRRLESGQTSMEEVIHVTASD